MVYYICMKITGSELIRIICDRQGVMIMDLAKRLGCTPQNLNNKLKRDNFTMNDMEKIADALGCDFVFEFKPKVV